MNRERLRSCLARTELADLRPIPFIAIAVLFAAASRAEELPDADFLEYLGSWEETDAEWIAIADWRAEETVDEKPTDRVVEKRKDDEQES